MIVLALLLQAAATGGVDSTYATTALREFVTRAAVANRAPAPELRGYTARVESELAFIMRDSLGRELTGQVEQLAARADWERNGRYELHVVGYRAQTMGNPYSALTFTRMYSVPTLFGNRLIFGMNDGVSRTREDSIARRRRMVRDSAAGRPGFRAVHPLAVDRDRYYRFTGGDTVAILVSAGRRIHLVRVFAHPVATPDANYASFRGELDFDADRHQLVRMRGRLETHMPRSTPLLLRSTGAVAVAFIDFENAEVDGRYWLPSVQRSEFQAQMQLLGDARPIYRIVTRFREHAPVVAANVAAADTLQLPATRARLTYASGDSVSRYARWESGLGTLSGGVHADDFLDLAPDVWQVTGAPMTTWWPKRLEEVVRYNRVEGMFTGVSAAVLFRDAAPGLSARGSAGWAWSEGTARGFGTVQLTRGKWTNAIRAERALETTNDFLGAFESGLSLFPLLFGSDPHDHVDRWSAGWSATRVLRDIDRGLLSAEAAWVRDRGQRARVTNPPLWGDRFRPNRNAASGDYARVTATLELNPRVAGAALSPGFGGWVKHQLAAGELDFQRTEVRLSSRHYWRGLVLASRVDAGMVTGDVIPPQALFEIGGGFDLPSYEYKEFGGDRAAIGRSLLSYQLPVLKTPRAVGALILPGLSPGVGVGAQAGWTEASSDAARAALLTLGGDGVTPLSRPSRTVRSTIDLRLTLLSGAIGFGIARPLDESRGWRWFGVWGASY